ncbi:hypothetical protein [Legionella jamestowniensis]|uniref:Uncharacterized protein n=1 Tax=Legionella jamestowniensis TaxID=455 RepID=A0A0W0UHQ3_9GAMM|nr:hypothetical protein [Legionella jamestowniensis]KTD07174.1 hypothetical protein Ljam_1369 [Legionella jamestowniensis]SFL71920.1 hypothetical protein SAMN02746073_1613 [Legionella jamestowniensis DSM 19215]
MYKQLYRALQQFLMGYYISIKYADIFEETLLKMAGIMTKPRRCQFGQLNDEQMFFTVKGIREDDN